MPDIGQPSLPDSSTSDAASPATSFNIPTASMPTGMPSDISSATQTDSAGTAAINSWSEPAPLSNSTPVQVNATPGEFYKAPTSRSAYAGMDIAGSVNKAEQQSVDQMNNQSVSDYYASHPFAQGQTGSISYSSPSDLNPPPTNTPTGQGSILDTAGSILASKPLQTIFGIGSKIARTVPTSIGEAMNIVESPILAAYQTSTQPSGNDFRSYIQNVKDNFSAGNNMLYNYWGGGGPNGGGMVSQFANGVNEISGRNLIENQGASHYLLAAADMVLDPANVLTLGVGGAIAKIAGEGNDLIGINKVGQEALQVLSGQIQQEAEAMGVKLTTEQVTQEAESRLSQAITQSSDIQLSPGRTVNAADLVDNGGIKFAGMTIPGTQGAVATVDALKSGIGKMVTSIPGVGSAVKMLEDGFVTPLNKIQGTVAGRIVSKIGGVAQNLATSAINQVQAMAKGVSKSELSTILLNRGNNEVLSTLSAKGQQAAQKIYAFMDSQADHEIASGLPITKIQNYMPQVWKNLTSDIISRINGAREEILAKASSKIPLTQGEKDLFNYFTSPDGRQITNNLPFFVNDRVLTPAAGDVLGLTRQTDFIKAMTQRLVYGTQGIAKQQAVNELVSRFGHVLTPKPNATEEGSNAAAIEDMVSKGSGEPVTMNLSDGTQAIIPQDIKNVVDNVIGASRNLNESSLPMGIQKILSGYDKMTSAFKTLITQYEPSFFVRHGADTLFRNILDLGVYQSLRPSVIEHSAILSSPERLSKMGGNIVHYGGQDMTLNELSGTLNRLGITNSGGIIEAGGAAGGGILGKITRAKQGVENTTRIQNFLLNFDKTGSVDQAMENMNKFQFDYRNMTGFERSVMQRVFPFYNFRRNNLSLQLSQMVNPRVADITRLLQQQQNYVGVNDQNAPSYAYDGGFSFPTKNSDGTVTYTKLGLSPDEANQALSIFTSKKGMVNGLDQMNPALKLASEYASGTDFFTGNKFNSAAGSDVTSQSLPMTAISKVFPGIFPVNDQTQVSGVGIGAKSKQVVRGNPYLAAFVGSLPITRLTSQASAISNPGKNDLAKAADYLLPVRQYQVTPSQQQTSQYFKSKDQADSQRDDLVRLGYIKQNNAGTYILNKNVQESGNPTATQAYRQQAIQYIKSAKNPIPSP